MSNKKLSVIAKPTHDCNLRCKYCYIEDDFADIMDSGPCNASPNKRISIKRLERSLVHTPIDYGVIFV